jgi:hypothetical protein
MHIALWFGFEERTVNMEVVPLAWPRQRAAQTKRDGNVVIIFRPLTNTNALHATLTLVDPSPPAAKTQSASNL